MKTNFNQETGKYEIEAKAEMFIIPNSAGKISEFFYKEQALKEAQSLCSSVGKEFDENNDKLVQVWICSDDLDTDNLCRHGAEISIEEMNYFLNYPDITEYIPVSLISNVKEGDTITLVFSDITANKRLYRNYDESKIKVDLKLNLKANQLNYRYRNFGRFEEVLRKVC